MNFYYQQEQYMKLTIKELKAICETSDIYKGYGSFTKKAHLVKFMAWADVNNEDED